MAQSEKKSIWWIPILLFLLSVVLAIATFIENSHGTQTAWAMIYDALWFKILLLLFGIKMLISILSGKFWKKGRRWILILHLALILILTGAGITRYLGFEGMMHIREGEQSQTFTSNMAYLTAEFQNEDQVESWKKPLLLSSLYQNHISHHFKTGDVLNQLKLIKFITGAVPALEEDPFGIPVLQLRVNEQGHTSVLTLESGELTQHGKWQFGFNTSIPDSIPSIQLIKKEGNIYIVSSHELDIQNMMHKTSSKAKPGESILLNPRTLYQSQNLKFALMDMKEQGRVKATHASPQQLHQEPADAIILEWQYGRHSRTITLFGGAGIQGIRRTFQTDNVTLTLEYGSPETTLPFALTLEEFKVERYSGSNHPSSFLSQVKITDEEIDSNMIHEIYMNHTLDHKGYRFFQSSYDMDEKGTILSVKYDPGTPIVYTGYILLCISFLIGLLMKNGRFRKLGTYLPVIFILVLFSMIGPERLLAQIPSSGIVDKTHAHKFGSLLVQDVEGRIKPVNTLSHEVLMKVNGEDTFENLHPNQVFLGMLVNSRAWQQIPLIKVKNKELIRQIGLSDSESYAAFKDFFDPSTRRYKLESAVKMASAKNPALRNKLDKAILKADEKLNICYMIYNNRFLKIFPQEIKDEPWKSPPELNKNTDTNKIAEFNQYKQSLNHALLSGNWTASEHALENIIRRQKTHKDQSPSPGKIKAEILFYEWQIFEKLMPFYMTLSLIAFIIAVISILNTSPITSGLQKLLFWIALLLLLIHTIGLGMRWYISEHAPWSNGYESMIYASWACMLAGLIFARRQGLVLASTALLSGLILLVAHLSWMDPRITQLVPILRSYWLTLHVSVIMSSYGFLGVSAIISFISLWIMPLFTHRIDKKIKGIISELSIVSQRAMILGLFLLVVGTILGSVWANESWGRYWGWDPKETWTLIAILCYSALLHARISHHPYWFHVLTILCFGTILMTYFGVNYYLSGLHSYAGGDVMQVPGWIWGAFIVLCPTLAMSFQKRNQWKMDLRGER